MIFLHLYEVDTSKTLFASSVQRTIKTIISSRKEQESTSDYDLILCLRQDQLSAIIPHVPTSEANYFLFPVTFEPAPSPQLSNLLVFILRMGSVAPPVPAFPESAHFRLDKKRPHALPPRFFAHIAIGLKAWDYPKDPHHCRHPSVSFYDQTGTMGAAYIEMGEDVLIYSRNDHGEKTNMAIAFDLVQTRNPGVIRFASPPETFHNAQYDDYLDPLMFWKGFIPKDVWFEIFERKLLMWLVRGEAFLFFKLLFEINFFVAVCYFAMGEYKHSSCMTNLRAHTRRVS